MRIVHVSHTDLAGKRFNGFDLHHKLSNEGIYSHYLTWNKQSHDSKTSAVAPPYYADLLRRGITKFEEMLSLPGFISPFTSFITQHQIYKQSDIVHFHLIYPALVNFLSLPQLSRKKHLVWTIHDLFPFTGHCVYPHTCTKWHKGCNNCPQLHTPFPMIFDTSAMLWRLKSNIFKKTRVDIIVASQWMKNAISNSAILRNMGVYYIPFGINTDLFRPISKVKAKKALNISAEKFVIGFRASSNSEKGLDVIKNVLHRFKRDNLALVVFDEKGRVEELKDHFEIHQTGWLNDDIKLNQAYNACDIFLMPSKAESFGMMAIEASAAGVPVIAGKGTALDAIVKHRKTGILIDIREKALQEAICNIRTHRNTLHFLSDNARKLAVEHYSFDTYYKKHLDLYNSLTS